MSGGRTCLAAVTRKGQRCAVEELPVPTDLAGGALVQVEAAAVCGTDWAHYTDDAFWDRGAVVLGHENVGRVVAVDPSASSWGVSIGDRVVVEETLPCGLCVQCRDGHGHRCPATDFRNPGALRYGRTPIDVWPGLWGGFAELLYVHPRAGLHRVPDGLDPHVAAFSNPVANGLRWITRVAALGYGEHVVVIGPGAHGLGSVLAARAAGAGQVIAVGLAADSRRLRDAELLGADLTLRADEDDVAGQVLEATRGWGADVVVDLTPGSAEAVELAVQVAAVGGRILLAGHKGHRPVDLDADEVLRKELCLFGVRGPDRRGISASLQVLERHADRVAALHTVTFPLTLVDDAIRLVGRQTGAGASHVIVDPRDTTTTTASTRAEEAPGP